MNQLPIYAHTLGKWSDCSCLLQLCEYLNKRYQLWMNWLCISSFQSTHNKSFHMYFTYFYMSFYVFILLCCFYCILFYCLPSWWVNTHIQGGPKNGPSLKYITPVYDDRKAFNISKCSALYWSKTGILNVVILKYSLHKLRKTISQKMPINFSHKQPDHFRKFVKM